MIDSLEVGSKKVRVNMLQYVDDTLFFCHANSKSVFNVKAMLNCFELSSGLEVNFLKSIIGGVGVNVFSIRGFAAILNCDTMKVPFKYLGLPIGGCYKRVVFWDGVLDKIKSILGRWKGRNLSMFRRICLIKFVLSFIPLFYMSMFRLPTGVMKKIESIQMNFLWGWGSEGRKIVWVSWKKVCETKGEGGLGVINVKDFNLALLNKWIWRLGFNEGDLLEEVLESKYCGYRNLKEDKGSSYDSLWWKDLKRNWQIEKWGNNFGDYLNWEIGNKKSIGF